MRSKPIRRSSFAWAALAAAAGGCSPSPAAEPVTDPCAYLSSECPYCADPGPKQACQTAVTSGDPVQCTVVLDDVNVIADCVLPDAGSDATVDASTDAPALPICDAAQASADAACACVSPCVTTCPGGGCVIDCPAGATCQGSCTGGGCIFQCPAGSTCTDACEGGGCAFQCAVGAVCTTTCPATPACVGL